DMLKLIIASVVAAFTLGLTFVVPPTAPVFACGDSCDCNKGHKEAKADEGEKEADANTLVAQPDAKVGDKTLCPIMGNEFTISESSPSTEIDGKTVYFCCPGCADAFAKDPEGLLAAHVA